MKKNCFAIEIEFTTAVLGSQPNKDVVTEFIHPPAVEEDEMNALPEKLEKATTGFHRVDGQPVFFDYQVKGFLKEAAKVMNGLKVKDVKALRAKVEDHVFVEPRIIPLVLPEGGEIDYCERPLRAETMQGPRVALARSERAPAGSKLTFDVRIFQGSPINVGMLEELLSYGEDRGLGQWRNGGNGRFKFRIMEKG